MSAEVDKQLVLLRENVMLELRLHNELQQLQGMLEPILATSLGSATLSDPVEQPDLKPLQS